MIDMPSVSACAPEIAADTLQKIIMVESGGNPFAVNVNKLSAGSQPKPKNVADAVAATQYWIAKGYSVDVGLMQVNSRNFKMLGITDTELSSVFEPCNNVKYGATILLSAWNMTSSKEHQNDRLMKSLSIYNTGNDVNGFKNGYVSKYVGRNISGSLAKTVVTPYNADSSVGFNADSFYWNDL
ncbi:lytic transglycosylase domain-containing protein [Serratia marcescens]